MSDSETAARIKNSQSKSFRKMNPHLFGTMSGIVNGPGIHGSGGGEDDAEHDHIAALTAKPKAKKRIRQSSKPLLNRLETEFFNQLEFRYPSLIHSQAVRLRLANGLTYSPDFVVISEKVGCRAYEVKGKHAFEDSLVKLKTAATLFPTVQFFLVWKDEHGIWQEQRVLA